MYIVRDIKKKKILHINPAPLTQKLEDKEVYARFDAERMEIGKWEGATMPVTFTINRSGMIIAEDVGETAPADGSVPAIDPNAIPPKLLSQMVAGGEIVLLPHQKISGKGSREKIVDKSLSEQVKGGNLELASDQKIIRDGKSEQIVNKSQAELVKDGVITINEPFDYIDGERIAQRTLEDLIKKKLLKTAAHRKVAIVLLDQRIESEIASKYSPGRELKMLKEYIDWQNNGKPKNDEREKQYLKLQKDIVKIRNRHNKLKKALEK